METPTKTYIKKGRVLEKNIKQNWLQIAEMSVLGYNAREIAAQMGMNYDGVKKILVSPEIRAYIESLRSTSVASVENIRQEMVSALNDHKEVPRDILSDMETSPALKARVFFNMADRVGLSPRSITPTTTAMVSTDELIEIRNKVHKKVEGNGNGNSLPAPTSTSQEQECEIMDDHSEGGILDDLD